MISKKKKKVFTKIETDFSSNFANLDVWGGAVFVWGGLFAIFHRKSASKAQKTCDFAYFTSQWGGSSPPPGYATVYKYDKIRVSNRTVNPNEPFHFGEPEPNLNQQNFTSVNLNQIWTLKIVLKWTQTEPEPLIKVRIYFSISGCRWPWYTHNMSSGDHRQDQQFLLFSGRNE